jgi:hypothetical protein
MTHYTMTDHTMPHHKRLSFLACSQSVLVVLLLAASTLAALPTAPLHAQTRYNDDRRSNEVYYDDPPQVSYVGIPSSAFNPVYAEQINTQWCWAACIQMVLNYYGVNISQYDIVRRTYGRDPYGRLPNAAANYELITANLNNWGIDRNGIRYVVRASIGYGAPDPASLVDELNNQRPVLLGYALGTLTGHAVVATAAGFSGGTDYPRLQSVVVRDPRRTSLATPYRGRQEYDTSLLRATSVYWYIRVQRLDDLNQPLDNQLFNDGYED